MMLESAEYLRANDTKYQHSARPHPRQLGEKHFFLGAQQLLLGTTITISTTVMSCKDKIGGVQQHVRCSFFEAGGVTTPNTSCIEEDRGMLLLKFTLLKQSVYSPIKTQHFTSINQLVHTQMCV